MSERYTELAALFNGLGDDSPSALQGFIAGLMGGGAPQDEQFWLLAMERFLDAEGDLGGGQKGALISLATWVHGQLSDEGFSFELLLPEQDEVGIDAVAGELQQWAHGYLVGFGTAGKGEQQSQYSEDVQAALTDLVAISQMEIEPEEEEDDEAANALMEVEEYLRVTAQLIFVEQTTTAAIAQDDGPDSDATLH